MDPVKSWSEYCKQWVVQFVTSQIMPHFIIDMNMGLLHRAMIDILFPSGDKFNCFENKLFSITQTLIKPKYGNYSLFHFHKTQTRSSVS